ncbi:MAG: tetratricopeptide repeat protein [Nitrospirae bacterium]|nr:tetratricopeptide repeat protein [Nitrospirota bacterium]MCL5237080.1 tetratricopeptide repeat protein [Nitrospirota bacterium]
MNSSESDTELKGQRGHIHIIGPLVIILVLIGGWYVWKSYKEEKLKENMSVVMEDCKNAVVSVVSDEKDKEKVEQLFQQIKQVTDKYQNENFVTDWNVRRR